MDEDAVICDFAETYNIYDYTGLPLKKAALLAVGFREDSRIKMLMTGAQAPADIMLFASMVDRLSLLVWAQTQDAQKGKNRPKSIMDAFIQKESNTVSYTSGEDFIKARERLLNPRG